MTLSVVVTVVEGGAALEACLSALTCQHDPPALEILVPYDDTAGGAASIAPRYPQVTFLPMGPVETAADARTARGQHELFDRRRAHGLRAVSGDVVAILEDRGVPTADWARTIARLHAECPWAVIGGSVGNAVDRPMNWAMFFCDFSRYQAPFEAGPAKWVTDVNVSYKRAAIERVRDLWQERYHEPVVHDALRAAGETLYLTPDFSVNEQRSPVAMADALRERIAWGRLFGATRSRGMGPVARLLYLAASPLIPLVLLARLTRAQWRKGTHVARFLRVSPRVALLLLAWSVGEAIGYASARP
jgi:hypothetical protein